ncbi:uncharacterized protein F5Z01DRAFT_672680 [Emericellopsis atlantica]|uniref:Uncharacterized protein n=1 Tax=Emericellopsis atlantica TaxID=2614577 RepID=A0A9P7ZPQ7_9HYPO|nr:uncharacterized protein F5Z01DRAFT_672680 [Emericellopsis atlantica]KAG9256039.1 hypothetical protein F5Z01DRAFT_672680 [Emericellopsis atlantica]
MPVLNDQFERLIGRARRAQRLLWVDQVNIHHPREVFEAALNERLSNPASIQVRWPPVTSAVQATAAGHDGVVFLEAASRSDYAQRAQRMPAQPPTSAPVSSAMDAVETATAASTPAQPDTAPPPALHTAPGASHLTEPEPTETCPTCLGSGRVIRGTEAIPTPAAAPADDQMDTTSDASQSDVDSSQSDVDASPFTWGDWLEAGNDRDWGYCAWSDKDRDMSRSPTPLYP